MGQLLLVRHGQASWGAADYDVLSATGEEQAAVLGKRWSQLDPVRVVHGTMQRQRRTAEIMAQIAGWPAELQVDARWDEMDHPAILAAHPRSFSGEPDRRQFQEWFEAATRRWTDGEYDDEYDESFPAFTTRVIQALADLPREGTVVVVTSGGPISWVTSDLLEADTPTYARLAPVVVNTSVTRVVAGRRGLSLVSFNEHGHLDDRPDLLTYR